MLEHTALLQQIGAMKSTASYNIYGICGPLRKVYYLYYLFKMIDENNAMEMQWSAAMNML